MPTYVNNLKSPLGLQCMHNENVGVTQGRIVHPGMFVAHPSEIPAAYLTGAAPSDSFPLGGEPYVTKLSDDPVVDEPPLDKIHVPVQAPRQHP